MAVNENLMMELECEIETLEKETDLMDSEAKAAEEERQRLQWHEDMRCVAKTLEMLYEYKNEDKLDEHFTKFEFHQALKEVVRFANLKRPLIGRQAAIRSTPY
eukprot:1469876-Amphidinium_carterae.1